MFQKRFDLDRTVRVTGLILIIVGLCYLVNTLSEVLLPFFISWFIAYMLNPAVDFVQDRLKFTKRLPSVLFVMFLLLFCIIMVISLAATSIQMEVDEINQMMQHYLETEDAKTYMPQVEKYVRSYLASVNMDYLFSSENLDSIIDKVIPQAYELLASSVKYIAGLVVLFIMTLYLFFILMDFHELSVAWKSLIPKKYRTFAGKLVSDLGRSMNLYFRKQAFISLIVGILFAIGFSLLGLPMSVLLGLFVGLLNMIPYMHTLGIIPPTIIALIQTTQTGQSFWVVFGWIILIFCIIQVILDGFLTPKIMGKATGLRPAVILLALSVWGYLLGMLGMIIALPLTSLITAYYRMHIIEGMPLAQDEPDTADTQGSKIVHKKTK